MTDTMRIAVQLANACKSSTGTVSPCTVETDDWRITVTPKRLAPPPPQPATPRPCSKCGDPESKHFTADGMTPGPCLECGVCRAYAPPGDDAQPATPCEHHHLRCDIANGVRGPSTCTDCGVPWPPGDDAGRCAECDGKGAHHHVEEPYYVPCFACKGTGRAGGGR